MAMNTFPVLLALLAALLVAHTVSCEEESIQSDIIFIENPDTNPEIINLNRALLHAPARNRVCTTAMCQRVCRSLNFRYGRCNRNKVCMCSV